MTTVINKDKDISTDLRVDIIKVMAMAEVKCLRGLNSYHQADGTIARLVELSLRHNSDITFDENEDDILI